ncbi:5'-nucleotidase C-terminal domain-containing protein [Pseudidiomarina woesei]|uniref:2',3'-cyclic-nucleotide 2'-phosphodiesterase/5'-or 3'-nucleotidase, 5'-nucleotidase family n=1 Tax=Pseudidiomarina woesei TaxID=1381080 RepID=A0A0K6GW19_9GAMM|nr:5'-nucleotidase C-terminal domain-containing protein [Pseudidiomarina woesei]CUA82770.1 2',3'-cyclic-nucleotide 2'-phosphodiesterase/5'-or 3'-nucleotidase, 5'-nucleotidase family [Pseudidiomarina woesei]
MATRKLAWYLFLFPSILLLMSNSYANQPITLKLLATSDVHGHFSGYNYFSKQAEPFGLAHLVPIIQQQRQASDISLLIDNGDLIQGSPLTDMLVANYQASGIVEREPSVAQLLTLMGYDAANLGNHEFNYGLAYLQHAYGGDNFSIPLLSANLTPISTLAKGSLRHKPFHMFSFSPRINGHQQRLKVAVVGVLPPQIMQWDAHHLRDQVEVTDMLTAATQAVAEAQRAGADIIVLAAHSGMPKNSDDGVDSEQGVWQLAQIPAVDAIIFGHQHEIFPGSKVYDQLAHINSQQGTLFGKPSVQPGTQGKYLGVIDLSLTFSDSNWQVVETHSQVIAAAKDPDPKVLEHLTRSHRATETYMQQAIGHSAHDLSLAKARLEPTHALQFIHSAQRWYVERTFANSKVGNKLPQRPLFSAVAPFNAALNEQMYTDNQFTFVPQGVLTLGHIGDLYRYPNTLEVVAVTGVQLKRWLEQSAAALQPSSNNSPWGHIVQDIPSYQFDTFAGFEYQIDVSKPIGERVSASISFAASETYYVATNNYRAQGGGGFAGLDGSQVVFSSPDQIQHILVSYLAYLGESGYRDKLAKNWVIKD